MHTQITTTTDEPVVRLSIRPPKSPPAPLPVKRSRAGKRMIDRTRYPDAFAKCVTLELWACAVRVLQVLLTLANPYEGPTWASSGARCHISPREIARLTPRSKMNTYYSIQHTNRCLDVLQAAGLLDWDRIEPGGVFPATGITTGSGGRWWLINIAALEGKSAPWSEADRARRHAALQDAEQKARRELAEDVVRFEDLQAKRLASDSPTRLDHDDELEPAADAIAAPDGSPSFASADDSPDSLAPLSETDETRPPSPQGSLPATPPIDVAIAPGDALQAQPVPAALAKNQDGPCLHPSLMDDPAPPLIHEVPSDLSRTNKNKMDLALPESSAGLQRPPAARVASETPPSAIVSLAPRHGPPLLPEKLEREKEQTLSHALVNARTAAEQARAVAALLDATLGRWHGPHWRGKGS
jgi:hypothetical protein